MRMHRLLWGMGLLAVMGMGAGCAHDETKQARSQGEKVGEAVAEKVRFANEVSLMNQEQIALARLAQQTSDNPEVRRFAEELLRDHQRNAQDLESLAKAKAISLAALDLTWTQEGVGGAGYEGVQKGIEKGSPGYDEKLDKKTQEFIKRRDKLAGLSGHEFDKAFLKQVRHDQHAGAKLVDKGLDKYPDDAALAAYLGRTAPVLSSHEQRAESLKGIIGD